jgi:hypothetical protein
MPHNLLNKDPWTNIQDPSEDSPLVRIYTMNDEPMFGMGATCMQHEAITDNLNLSYQRGLKHGQA